MNNKSEEIVWVDVLCIETLLLILIKHRKAEQVRFFEASSLLLKFLPKINTFFNLNCVQVLDFYYGEEKVDGLCIYQYIHRKAIELLGTYCDELIEKTLIKRWCLSRNFSPTKVRYHLFEAGFYKIHRPLDAISNAQVYFEKNSKPFTNILRTTPFRSLLKEEFQQIRFQFYTPIVSQFQKVESRSQYLNDKVNQQRYFNSPLQYLI